MKFSIIFVLFVALFFNACSATKKELNLDERPEMQIPIKVKKQTKNYKGTLYSRAGASLFADKKDLQIGDILQVNISEALKNDSKNTRALTKDNTSSLGAGVLAPGTGVLNSAGTTSRIGRFNNAFNVGFSSKTANSFSGSATSKFDESFSTLISVVIIRVYQNGNYFIKGTKKLLINNQKQEIGISGVIRPYDISPENTVSSSQIANLKVLYKKDGEEVDVLEKSWGTKIIETIWPF
ncbi:MAG TPA: flagellar basal body L-ring protein FlgH [Arcobacter sp.]|nr:flagellar basal body L-ring protein FlgH [Arcobacter sp.]HIP56385.1 flagellar basal body L-ring protein FlgH [Arcobacter sp.]